MNVRANAISKIRPVFGLQNLLNRNKTLVYRQRNSTSTFSPLPTGPDTTITKVITNWMQRYEDFIGISAVKDAQNKVIRAEKKFQETQESRRELQRQIQELQVKLKDIHRELDKTTRGEDRYLHLITQEHAVIKDERTMLENFRSLEKDERDYFSALSLAVRESHEQERTQAERTKYWSLIGSVCGAIIGIVGTTINNRMRMKELRQLVTDASTKQKDDSSLVTETQRKMESFLDEVKQMLVKQDVNEGQKVNGADNSNQIEAMEKRLSMEMNEVKSMIAAQLLNVKTDGKMTEEDIKSLTPVSVYFGEDLGQIVTRAEQNLEWKMKINSLATVAAFYGMLAVTIPIIFHMFKGN